MKSTLAVSLAVIALVACKGSDGDDGEAGGGGTGGSASPVAACEAVEACEGATGRAECEAVFDLVVPSAACTEAIESASCEEHASEDPAYEDICYPPCDGSVPRCNGDDTLTRCLEYEGELRLTTVRCEGACAASNASYAGVCGREYAGRTSSEDKCFCDGDSGIELPLAPPAGATVRAADAVDPDLLCESAWECMAHCDYDIEYVLVDDECLAALDATTCEGHALEVPPYKDACFPECDARQAFCNEDENITVCEPDENPQLRWRTYSCQRVCEEEQGLAFSGVCDASLARQDDPYAACVCDEE